AGGGGVEREVEGLLPGWVAHAALVETEPDLRHLAKHAAVEAAVLLDAGAHLVEQGPDEHGRRRAFVGKRVAEHRLIEGEDVLADRFGGPVLGSAVVESPRPPDP